jgi:pimeloyl-ACP methyl ester carboxylesterase
MAMSEIAVLAETLRITIDDRGSGRQYLLLHGGAGPRSMGGLAGALAPSGRTVLPTHPGFDGRMRPEWCHRIEDLALVYLALIESLDLDDIVVVGHSLGGWLAAEIGLRGSPRLSAVVLIDAVGLAPAAEGATITDLAPLPPPARAALSFHDPARSAAALAGRDPAVMRVDEDALRVYAGDPYMHDPTLRGRLPGLALPTLVLWGESDRIVTPAYGKQFADAIPNARFELIARAGHLPQIEQLDEVTAAIEGWGRRR